MGNSQSDTPNSQPVPTNDPEESHFEDEINLIDYFRVVWKWKSLILLGSVSPALIVALKGYLNSYIKRIKNGISVSAPVSENPKISSIAKGTVKKSTIVFAIALMISVFAAFLLEGFKQNKMRNGK